MSPLSQSLLSENPTWCTPQLISLTENYEKIFQYYRKQRCGGCSSLPRDPAICLVCGKLVCFKEYCCKTKQQPAVDTYECVQVRAFSVCLEFRFGIFGFKSFWAETKSFGWTEECCEILIRFFEICHIYWEVTNYLSMTTNHLLRTVKMYQPSILNSTYRYTLMVPSKWNIN